MPENIVGDALHVMFNAPIVHADHAQRAVAAAVELDTFCQNYSAHQRSLGIDFGLTRIGINTGVTVVGNFGGKDRLEYTAQGDAINIAARLEGANKHLGTRVCISDFTVAQCNGLTFRPIGYLVLKGKSASVKVWEPVGLSDSQNAGYREYLQAYQHLEDGEAIAQEIFEALHNTFENDNLVKFQLNRLRAGESGTTIVLQEK